MWQDHCVVLHSKICTLRDRHCTLLALEITLHGRQLARGCSTRSRGLTMGPGTGSIESPQHQIPPPHKTACRRLKTGALLESAAQSSRRRTFTQDAGELCARRTQRLCARACPHAMRSAAIFPAEVPLRCRGLPTNSQRGLVTGLLYRHSCAEEQFTVPGWPGQAAEDCECQVCWHPLVHLSDKISLPEGGGCS